MFSQGELIEIETRARRLRDIAATLKPKSDNDVLADDRIDLYETTQLVLEDHAALVTSIRNRNLMYRAPQDHK